MCSSNLTVPNFRSLEHDTFLNDIIIDFYLTYLFNEKLSNEDQSTVYVFSTMFYKSLTTGLKKPLDAESELTPAERRHAKVKGWTKSVDLFKNRREGALFQFFFLYDTCVLWQCFLY